MERRRDRLLRGVVDQVQPALLAAGFGLADRGSHPEVHWVEYRAAHSRSSTTAPQARVMLAHVLDNHTLGASVRWYHGAAFRAAALTQHAWAYAPGSDRTPEGTGLAPAVAAWIRATLIHGPTRGGTSGNGRASIAR
jgi:hypothetical protein